MIVRYMLEKEFKQFMRNPLLPRLAVMFPLMILLIFPLVATFEVKNINVTVVDNDNSQYSRRLIQKISGSSYFNLNGVESSYGQGLDDVEKGVADVVLDIPADFEKRLTNKQPSGFQISANAVNGVKGNLGSSYINGVVGEFVQEIMHERGAKMKVPVEVIVRNRYNATLDSKAYMIPALITMVLVILCGFFPALNIVSEKEIGTIEQINVTPVSKSTFILAKLIPYWVVGLLAITIAFTVSWVVYDYLPSGSFVVIYAAAMLFILLISAFGLIVSNNSSTIQQAMFVMFFFVMAFVLMSGLLTPIRSMPQWAQYLSLINPPRYFIAVMRSVYQKGGTMADNSFNFMMLSVLTFLLGLWAVISYRKQN